MSKTIAIVGMSLLVSSGCALNPGDSHVSIRYYDFGAEVSQVYDCEVAGVLRGIKSSASLQGNRIWYRYHDTPFEPIPYAVSQWSSAPSVLLKRRLQPMFQSSPTSGVLYIDLMLEQLEIHIESDGQGTAHLSVTTTATKYQVEQGRIHSNYARSAHASPEGIAEATALLIADYSKDLCGWVDSLKTGVNPMPERRF